MLSTFARLYLQLRNSVEYISCCELFSYCYMCIVFLWPKICAFSWTWLSKFRSHNCWPRTSYGASLAL